MAYDVARVRGLHPSLGDGWVHFDAQHGMLRAGLGRDHRVHRLPRVDGHNGGPAPVGSAQRRGAERGPPGGGRSGQCGSAWVVLGADRAVC